jgi:Spy/CpxP family protein refolding chaperone
MTFAKTIVLLTFAALFGAGVVTGLMVRRFAPPSDQPRSGRSWIASQLDLTPDQNTKMRETWDSLREHNGARDRQRRQCAQQRDKDVVGLMTPEQKAQYDQIIARYDAAVAKLREEAAAEMQAAEDHTRALLTPDQLKKYDELSQRQRDARNQRGGPGSRPSTRGGPGGPPPFGGPPGPGGPPPDGAPATGH